MDISKCRQQIFLLNKERNKLLQIIMNSKKMLKGTLYERGRICGYPNCKCAIKGELHISWYLSYSHNGKTKMKYIKRNDYLKVKQLTDNYRKFRTDRARIVKIETRIIDLINKIEKLKMEEWENDKEAKPNKAKKSRKKFTEEKRETSAKTKK